MHQRRAHRVWHVAGIPAWLPATDAAPRPWPPRLPLARRERIRLIADLEADGWELEDAVRARASWSIATLFPALSSRRPNGSTGSALPPVLCCQVDDQYACLRNLRPKPHDERRLPDAWSVVEVWEGRTEARRS